jgi:hypothetical protein
MGREGLPLLLEELSKQPDHWLVALNAITGIDPVPTGATFKEAVDAWLEWGRKKGYLPQWNGTPILRTTFPDCATATIRLRVRATQHTTA